MTTPNIEIQLQHAISAVRLAQEEILFPCELYTQLDDMICALETIVEDKTWDGRVL